MNKIKAGIVGGAGYTAGELIRILIHHPGVELTFIQSESNAGQPVSKVHQDLFYLDQLTFSESYNEKVDVLFLCKGHGESESFLRSLQTENVPAIVDLSQDFRIKDSNPDLQRSIGEFVYGLPELNREQIKKTANVANPGCFATCIQLGLLPLAWAKLISEDVHISAITGSTGAGQKLSATSHFSWRNNNISVYKAFTHQHLKEIHQSLTQLQHDLGDNLNFIPYRGNFTRGIIATMYLDFEKSEEEAKKFFRNYYSGHPFVRISEDNIHLKQVVNTNYCLLYIEKIKNKLMIISIIDNLLKGASGQAVQNMNLMFGMDESTGLGLKGISF